MRASELIKILKQQIEDHHCDPDIHMEFENFVCYERVGGDDLHFEKQIDSVPVNSFYCRSNPTGNFEIILGGTK